MTHVYCLGIAVLDVVYGCPDIPNAATKYKADSIETVTGGGATNAAIAIAKLGGSATLAARLGDDPQGAAIRSDLAQNGVNIEQLQLTKGAQSSSSSIIVDQLGERQIINFRGANLTEKTDWLSLPGSTKSVLADTRWPDGMAHALELAKEAGIPGIVDVDTPLDACDLSDASHLAFARRALSELTGTDTLEDGLRRAADQLCAWVCVTDGSEGCYYFENNTLHHIPALKVDVKDTLGAGDVWHGAFALKLAEGASEPEACQFANTAAALKCTQKGVAKGMPDRATVDRMMKEIIR